MEGLGSSEQLIVHKPAQDVPLGVPLPRTTGTAAMLPLRLEKELDGLIVYFHLLSQSCLGRARPPLQPLLLFAQECRKAGQSGTRSNSIWDTNRHTLIDDEEQRQSRLPACHCHCHSAAARDVSGLGGLRGKRAYQ